MMVRAVFSNNLAEQYEATQKFRKLLSIGAAGCEAAGSMAWPRGGRSWKSPQLEIPRVNSQRGTRP